MAAITSKTLLIISKKFCIGVTTESISFSQSMLTIVSRFISSMSALVIPSKAPNTYIIALNILLAASSIDSIILVMDSCRVLILSRVKSFPPS